MDKKNIWIISHYASPIKYGYGTRLFMLGEEFIKMGHNVTIFTSTSNYQLNVRPVTKGIFTHEDINGIDLVWIRGIEYSDTSGFKRVLSWFIFSFLLMFYRTKIENKPDVIIVSSLSIIPVINGWLWKKRFPKCHFILEIRDIWPQSLIEIGGYSKLHPLVILLGWFEKFGYKHADHIVATMPRADRHIKSKLKKPFKFTYIPQGVDLNVINDTIDLTPDEKRSIFPESGFVVGYAGSIGRSNSLETLIDAAKIIKERSINDIFFIILGEGNAKPDLIKMSDHLGNVTFVPKISKNKVQSFLGQCDILYASAKPVPLYNYGISLNKLIDYMLSGKPIVFSFSGFDSLINEADCGTVIPADDSEKLVEAILHYYNMRKNERENIGKKGRDYVLENRTFDKLAKQYQIIFRSLESTSKADF
jgi:glycosyltransferase involved in cell wall biosynthesis